MTKPERGGKEETERKRKDEGESGRPRTEAEKESRENGQKKRGVGPICQSVIREGSRRKKLGTAAPI